MAEVMKMHELDDELGTEFDKLMADAEEWAVQSMERHKKAMAEAAELVKGKKVTVHPSLHQDILNDQLHQRILKLSLPEVLVYSGQARIATHKETRKLSRT